MMRIPLICMLLTGLLLTDCSDHGNDSAETSTTPVEFTRDALGYYCNMIVVDHRGPKGQVHIVGRDEPVWFSSVRDTIVFTLLPEEPKNIAAIYVNDMGRASWDRPESGTWIDAREAWFVIGSDKVGGMGAPETVPFANKADAESFVAKHGGQIVAFANVPEAYVLSDASASQHAGMSHDAGGMQHAMPASGSMAAGAGTDISMPHTHEHAAVKVVK